ncbi:MAG: DUF2510 domain-containing protein [Rhodococcus sp.]|nr:DUF2510 domain-containing protein [Rhodococcus sp. (in: high G+C Gram-positive bacteria)]
MLSMSASPGWHPDPRGLPQLRWWDGVQWTSAVHPFPPESSQAPADLPPAGPELVKVIESSRCYAAA